MSEHYFGLHRGHLLERADKIAARHGAGHINYTEPSGEKRGWFACANRGEPFDSRKEREVMDAINEAGGIDALRKKR